MSKYQDGDFIQIPRIIFRNGKFDKLSAGAKGLYLYLKELEHRYCGQSKILFFHTDKELAEEFCTSEKTIGRYRKELIDAELIQFDRKHFVFKDTQKKSEKRVGCYVLIDDS